MVSTKFAKMNLIKTEMEIQSPFCGIAPKKLALCCILLHLKQMLQIAGWRWPGTNVRERQMMGDDPGPGRPSYGLRKGAKLQEILHKISEFQFTNSAETWLHLKLTLRQCHWCSTSQLMLITLTFDLLWKVLFSVNYFLTSWFLTVGERRRLPRLQKAGGHRCFTPPLEGKRMKKALISQQYFLKNATFTVIHKNRNSHHLSHRDGKNRCKDIVYRH